jgi:cytochrome P450
MRVTTEPVDLGGGLVIAAGEFVIAEGLAANRDLAHFPNPDRFDPRRFAAERDAAMSPPLTFGLGAHYCLGANLARAELIEALPVLFGRLPGLRLAADHIDWRDKGFRAPVALPVWR